MTSPDSRLHRPTCPRQHPNNGARRLAGAGIRPVMRGPSAEAPSSRPRFPVAFRPPALASWASCSRPGFRPSLRSAYPADDHRWGPDGISTFRTCEIDRGGCPLYSGTAVLIQPTEALRLPPAASQRPVLDPSDTSHLRGCRCRSIRGFTYVHPSGLPLACDPRMERGPLGFSLKLPTPPLPATPVEVGTGPEHWPGTTPSTSTSVDPPIWESTHTVRPRVARFAPARRGVWWSILGCGFRSGGVRP